ncbi:MAG: WcaF family extracellular polysaccharide biosynthesis acetyltransferase [Bacteroidetes bacterium]|nr:WcaF family extracellular polysaccharide biosynthesis acetyltransferase [Bacteroidota bacterium]
MQAKTNLSSFNNTWYKPGKNIFVRGLWYITNLIFFKSGFPFYAVKAFLLRLFGAKIGKGLVIKPHVSIKYPWHLEIENHVWIGEYVWIDNLTKVTIRNNACISQGAMLVCGNHNYKKTSFDLIVKSIAIDEGAWVGAKSVVCPGAHLKSHSMLAVGSIAIGILEEYFIYQGNPAVKTRKRDLKAD